MARKVTPISGFPEWLPRDRIVEQQFLDVIREVFELHGFASINTRAMEPVDRLSNQGEDADKEIYAVRRLGGDDDHLQFALDGMRNRLAKHALLAQVLLELVVEAAEAAAAAGGQHDDDGL